jgi:acyl-coenzyme A synthetase/AMP-(fatty) acid ligase/acyl carrier protein
MNVLLPEILSSKLLCDLRNIIIGGEAAKKDDITAWLQHYPNHKLHNEYGPTEATIAVSQKEISISNISQLTIPVSIGKPALNTKLYVLSHELKLLPVGAIGELYIGGDNVARGYYKQEELTKLSFIQSPLNKSERIYKTGDLARWNHDGELEYLGRTDKQVKIRGYRIEPSEIESLLMQYPNIKNVVVVVKSKNKSADSLVAYIISDFNLEEKLLFDFLKSNLPEYMIPNKVIQVHDFPLTVNGKLDIDALPQSEGEINNNYKAPRTELEQSICELFSEVLNLNHLPVGVQDDFFTLGGNSISSIRLAQRIKKEIGLDIDVTSIFRHRTIDGLVKHSVMLNQQHEGEVIEF